MGTLLEPIGRNTAPAAAVAALQAPAKGDDPLRSEVPVPIARFDEKPDLATSEQFLAAGRFTLNSGIFLFHASAILGELEWLAPEVVSRCRAALDEDTADLDFLRLEREAFSSCPSVALDVAVMECTGLGNVLRGKGDQRRRPQLLPAMRTPAGAGPGRGGSGGGGK